MPLSDKAKNRLFIATTDKGVGEELSRAIDGGLVAYVDHMKWFRVALLVEAENEGSETIRVHGHIVGAMDMHVEGVKDVILTVRSANGGTPTMSILAGTNKKNSANELWLQTDAMGHFEIDVDNGHGIDQVLLTATIDGVSNSMLVLQFV
jgi:hypothetical protein